MADDQLAPPLRRQWHGSPCYVCRSCTTIVGWPEHLVSSALAIIPHCFLLTRVQTGNVFVGLRLYRRRMYRLFTLSCGICSSLLGWKFDESSAPLPPFFAEGRFIFFARSVYLWNGRNLLDPVWRPNNRIDR